MLIGEDRGHYLLILVIIPEEITRNWKQWKKLNFRVEHKLWKEISYLQARVISDIEHMWKNTIFFHVCCYGFCKGWKSLSNTVVYMMKSNFYLYIVNKWSHKAEWSQGLVSLVFSEVAEIVRVAARHGLFLEFSKTRVILTHNFTRPMRLHKLI